MNLTTMAGVVAVIPAGQSYSLGGESQINRIDWQQYSLHGSHATDLGVVTAETAV